VYATDLKYGAQEPRPTLEVDIIIKLCLCHSSRAVFLLVLPIKLLHCNLVTLHRRHPGHMPSASFIALRHGSNLGRLIDLKASRASCIVPGVGVSECFALVAVREFFVQTLVDAPGDEGSALAFEKVPAVDAAAGVLVGIVVSASLEFGTGVQGGLERV